MLDARFSILDRKMGPLSLAKVEYLGDLRYATRIYAALRNVHKHSKIVYKHSKTNKNCIEIFKNYMEIVKNFVKFLTRGS
jgi:hypothetical protein